MKKKFIFGFLLSGLILAIISNSAYSREIEMEIQVDTIDNNAFEMNITISNAELPVNWFLFTKDGLNDNNPVSTHLSIQSREQKFVVYEKKQYIIMVKDSQDRMYSKSIDIK